MCVPFCVFVDTHLVLQIIICKTITRKAFMDKVELKRKLRRLKREEVRIRAKGVRVSEDRLLF